MSEKAVPTLGGAPVTLPAPSPYADDGAQNVVVLATVGKQSLLQVADYCARMDMRVASSSLGEPVSGMGVLSGFGSDYRASAGAPIWWDDGRQAGQVGPDGYSMRGTPETKDGRSCMPLWMVDAPPG